MEDSLDAAVSTPPIATTSTEDPEPSPPSSPPTSVMNSAMEGSTNETSGGDDIQLEPTEEEIEKERLIARAEQLQDEIGEIRKQLQERENELAEVKEKLGITAFTEMKDGFYNGLKVMGTKIKGLQETDTFRKIDTTLVGWKTKLEDSERYQKTKQSLNEGGKKASSAFSSAATSIKENERVKTIGTKTSGALQSAGTAIKSTGTAIRDNERVQNFGERIRSTSVRIKDRVMGTSVDAGDEPVAKETVVPDEPTKKD